jgi:hypothetical protein
MHHFGPEGQAGFFQAPKREGQMVDTPPSDPFLLVRGNAWPRCLLGAFGQDVALDKKHQTRPDQGFRCRRPCVARPAGVTQPRCSPMKSNGI